MKSGFCEQSRNNLTEGFSWVYANPGSVILAGIYWASAVVPDPTELTCSGSNKQTQPCPACPAFPRCLTRGQIPHPQCWQGKGATAQAASSREPVLGETASFHVQSRSPWQTRRQPFVKQRASLSTCWWSTSAGSHAFGLQTCLAERAFEKRA